MSNCNRDLCKRHIPVVVNAIKRLDNTLNRDNTYVTSAPITVIESRYGEDNEIKKFINISGARELVNILYEREILTVMFDANGMLGDSSPGGHNMILNSTATREHNLKSQYNSTTNQIYVVFSSSNLVSDPAFPSISFTVEALTPKNGQCDLNNPFNTDPSVNDFSTKSLTLKGIDYIIPDETFNEWLKKKDEHNQIRIIYTIIVTSFYHPCDTIISQFLNGLGISDLLSINTDIKTLIE